MHPAKATIVEDLQAKLNSSPFLFIADYTGLKVSQFAELRNRLWGAGARCHVVKNTFLRRAAKKRVLHDVAAGARAPEPVAQFGKLAHFEAGVIGDEQERRGVQFRLQIFYDGRFRGVHNEKKVGFLNK